MILKKIQMEVPVWGELLSNIEREMMPCGEEDAITYIHCTICRFEELSKYNSGISNFAFAGTDTFWKMEVHYKPVFAFCGIMHKHDARFRQFFSTLNTFDEASYNRIVFGTG